MIFLAKQREQEKLLLLSLESLRTRLPSIFFGGHPAAQGTALGRMGSPILPGRYG